VCVYEARCDHKSRTIYLVVSRKRVRRFYRHYAVIANPHVCAESLPPRAVHYLSVFERERQQVHFTPDLLRLPAVLPEAALIV
jgi:hypothetical protein